MKTFHRTLAHFAMCLLLISVIAQTSAEEVALEIASKPAAPMVFSGANSKTKGEWQTKYTLGPNDVVSFAFYGKPELTRANVLIGPDGTVSYLQAQGLHAGGLTIDELRSALETSLARYYRNVRIIVTPGEFRSKRFNILGKVVNKGSYTLERPLTIVEAVAQAGGLETGIFQMNTVELADLPRSFLIRAQKRIPVDFEKLFRRGDLSQNILLEPDDYIYFPSSIANEVYVLGAVKSPGAQGLSVDASVLGCVTLAGGFTERAYRQKVLVVRGGLEMPQRFLVNASDILAGRTRDFRLEPRDIVYVSERPWARVEDLADIAATAFIQSMVTTWTGASIGPIAKTPFVPVLK